MPVYYASAQRENDQRQDPFNSSASAGFRGGVFLPVRGRGKRRQSERAAEVVHHNVGRAGVLGDGFDQARDAAVSHQVDGVSVVWPVGRRDFPADSFQRVLGTSDQNETGTFLRQLDGDGAADVLASASDQGQTILYL